MAEYVRLIQQHAKGDLLDCGCGAVPFYQVYQPLVDTITCVDWENSSHDISHLDAHADLNVALPLEANSYDTVLLTDVIEHLHSPTTLMAEVERVLRPGGAVFIGVPFMYRIHEEPHDYHRYTRFALERMLTEAGLEVEWLSAYGGYVNVLFNLLHRELSGRSWRYKLLRSLEKGMLGIGALNRRNEVSKAKYPLGYTVIARKPTL